MKMLLVDDNPFDRALIIRQVLKEYPGAIVVEVVDAAGLEKALTDCGFDVVITDYQLQWTTGIVVLKTIKERDPEVPVIMFTGTGNESIAVEALQAGLDDYVIKSAERYVRLPVSIRQVLEQKRLRRAERESAATIARMSGFSQLLLNSVADGILGIDRDGNHSFANPSALEMLGYESADLLGRDSHSLWHHSRQDGSSYPVEECPIHGSIQEEKLFSGKDFFWRKNGTSFPAEFTSAPLFENNECVGSVIAFRDITNQEKMHEALRRAEEEWRHTFDSISDFVSVHDSDFRFTKVNKALADFVGKTPEELVGLHCYEVFHGLHHEWPGCPHKEALACACSVSREVHDQQIGVPLLVTASPIHDKQGKVTSTVHIARDISAIKKAEKEREKLQAQLFHAQKMECVGQLAGGVAHDFNNQLTVIIGSCDLILVGRQVDEKIVHYVNQIKNAGLSSSTLVKQLLAFSHRQILETTRVNIDLLVQNLVKMLHRLIGENITLDISLESDGRIVEADPNQIEQVLINLVVNARDAIQDSGRISIETDKIMIDNHCDPELQSLEPGPYLRLTVSDTGKGITPEDQPRIFEPFFTTKAMGKGTGLGLATVYGIITQHRGHIDLESTPGQGTAFRILLPISNRPGRIADRKESPAPLGGTETILVVEDDPMSKSVLHDLLAGLGYRVYVAASSEEALTFFDKKDMQIDLVVTDLVLPGKSGIELVEILKQRSPSTRTLLVSGYPDERVGEHGVLRSDLNFLGKPLTRQKIGAMVRRLLDGE